ncbi:MAG TPA: response regulator [Chitinophagales bacterium]|nr:response regulator [Chitinophagales bacterium]
MAFRIFIIDDDAAMREMLKDFCETKYSEAEVCAFATGEAAMEDLYLKPEVIVLDYYLDSVDRTAMNGIETLKRIKELLPNTPVLFLSSQDNPEIAADTIKHGAYDYIVKNENAFNRLEIMINNSTGHLSLRKQLSVQRIFNIVLFILLVLALIGFIVSRYV